MLRLRWLNWFPFSKKAARPTKKCQIRKRLKEGFKEHMLSNVEAFRSALAKNSLKYAAWFGHNMSLVEPSNRMLFKEIKHSIRRNMGQLDAELCVMLSNMLGNYKCEGDEEDIVAHLKLYFEENLEEFEEKDVKKFEDNLFLFNQEALPLTKITPKLEPTERPLPFVKKQIQKLSIDTSPFSYNFTQLSHKLTLSAEGRTLRIVGIEHSVEWIESMRRELQKCQGVIVELVPFSGSNEMKQILSEDPDARLRRLMGTIRGVPEAATQKRVNTPFVLKDIDSYLRHFPAEGSLIMRPSESQQMSEVDELRSLLRHIPVSIDSVLLADITIEEEILQLAQRHSLEQIRQIYAFLRLLYINEQGRYLQQLGRVGCQLCGGKAQLLTPINVADRYFYPLSVREELIARNIHHFIKSTEYSHLSCFVGMDHVFPLFQQLSELYRRDGGWLQDRPLSQLQSIRPTYRLQPNTEAEHETEVNKIALLSSLYPRGLGQLPPALSRLAPLYAQLHTQYRELLHPFPTECRGG